MSPTVTKKNKTRARTKEQSEPKKGRQKTKRVVSALIIFVVVFGIVFGALNFSTLKFKVQMLWSSWFGNGIVYTSYVPEDLRSLGVASELIPPDDRIVIEAIGVNAPLIFGASAARASMLKDLESGVAWDPRTSHPGENGRVFLTGHSSNYTWAVGDYKNVFATLDQVEVGDQIVVYYKQHKYIYEILEELVVKPTDFSVLTQTEKAILTLMTCWPVGSINERYIVNALQVSPDPKNNAPAPAADIKPGESLIGR